MLPIDRADHRGASTASLLAAVAARDPLALAEAYHRTSAAAYACATRLLGDRDEVEGLLRAAYLALWQDPPTDAPLEAWMRHRVFVDGRAHLRQAGRGAAAPSTTLLLRDAPLTDAPLNRAERLIANLDDDALRALLLAHDRGIPTADQRDEAAEAGLRRALVALAEGDDDGGCGVARLGDLVLGLLDDDEADRVRAEAAASPACAAVLRTLKRGRRRVEGLPPPADLGQRVVAYVLAAGAAPAAGGPGGAGAAAALGEDDAARTPEAAGALEEPATEAAGALGEPATEADADALPAGAPSTARSAPDTWPYGVEEDVVPRAEGLAPSVLGGEPSEFEGVVADEAPPSVLDDTPATPQVAEGAGHGEGPETGEAVPEEAAGWDPVAEAPAAEPSAVAASGASWSTRPADEGDEERLRFEALDLEEEDEGKGRRALTVALTVIGALLLLAAGAVAGLLAIRIFLG